MVPEAVQDIVGEAITAGVAAFAHGKLKNPMQREIAKYAFIGAIFQIISKKASAPIENALAKILPGDDAAAKKSETDAATVLTKAGETPALPKKDGTVPGYMSGYYNAGTSGLYLGNDGSHGVGGAYMGVGGSYMGVGGLGLFEGKSIYG